MPRQRFLAVLFVVLGISVFAGACSEDTQQGIRDAVEDSGDRAGDDDVDAPAETEAPTETEAPPETEAPAETEAPSETEAPAEPDAPAEDDDSLSDDDWLRIAVFAVMGLLLLLIFSSVSGARSRKKEAARASFNYQLDQVTGSTRWVHDQASIDILAANDPAQLQAIWTATQSRIIEVEEEIAVLAAGVSDAPLQHSLADLGRALAETRNVLGSNVALRLQPQAGHEQLVLSSNQAVYDSRTRLKAAAAPVDAARQT